ncbi:Uma2 family endonuclease [Desulfococcaceae bacterium HSG8]|nr:Uma2 family endonuclease [Desulfococcaceae bacterium HSG8]
MFEILSPGNRPGEMKKKLEFYEQHGAEEYYIYDPDRNLFEARARLGKRLRIVKNTQGVD